MFRFGVATILVLLLVFSCGSPFSSGGSDQEAPGGTVTSLKVNMTSVLDGGFSASGLTAFGVGDAHFTTEPNDPPNYIISGPPEYVRVRLKTLYVAYASSPEEYVKLWEGDTELLLDGSDIDTSGIESGFLEVPEGTITTVFAEFDAIAKIKGSVSGTVYLQEEGESFDHTADITVYTNADYPYNATNGTGGALDYTAFSSGPAEEMEIDLSGDGDSHFVGHEGLSIPLSNDSEEATGITFVFDLNRTLRFYNGRRGPNGGAGDEGERAYFFGHTMFPVAVFPGEVGRVEGYEYLYASYDRAREIGADGDPPFGVPGWMTLIFGRGGEFLDGILIGDDDNDLTVAKGGITEWNPQDDGSINFVYDIDHGENVFYVDGFYPPSTENTAAPIAGFDSDAGVDQHGEARFTLRLLKE